MARKRVNKKFLVGLVSVFGVLVLALLVAGIWYKDSPERAVRRATQAEERGDREEAAVQWNKAFERTGQREYLLKGIDTALSDTTGDDGAEWIARALGSYQALLSSDPGYMPARHGQLELLSNDRSFNAPVLTHATREARKVAGEILQVEPDDTRARSVHAIATLNLSQFAGSGVTEAEKEAAVATLEDLVASDPGDGQAILVLTGHRASQALEARNQDNFDGALEIWQEMFSLLEQAEKLVEDPGDDATLKDAKRSRYLGESFAMLARLKPRLDAARLVADGQDEDSITMEELTGAEPTATARQKGLAHLEQAVNATDVERDALRSDFLEIYTAYAAVLSADGQPDEAIEVLRGAVEARPWDSQAAAAVVRMLQEQQRIEEAADVARTALAAQSEPLPRIGGPDGHDAHLGRFRVKPIFVDALLTRAEQIRPRQGAEADQLVAQAREVFDAYESERATRQYGLSPQVLRIRGQFQQVDGNPDRALTAYNEALRMLDGSSQTQERARLLALTAQVNVSLNQLGGARQAYGQLLQLNPRNLAVAERLAQVMVAAGEGADARITLGRDRYTTLGSLVDQLLEADPDKVSYQQLAMAITPADDREERLAEMPEETTRQRKLKLNTAVRLGNREEAVRLGRALVEAEPDDPEVKIVLAAQLYGAGEEEEALALVRPLAESGHERAQSLLTRWEGGVEGVIASLEGTERLLAEAQVARRDGDMEAVVAKYAEAHELEPKNRQVAEQLFQLYVDQQSLDEARRVAETLAELNSDRMNGRSYDVRLMLARGDFADAVTESQRLANEYRNVAHAQALHGQTLAAAGRFSEAEDPLRRALDLSPTNVTTISMLVTALEQMGRQRETGELIQAGLRLSPNNAFLTQRLRDWQLRFGDAQELIAQRREAVAEQPDSAQAHVELIDVLLVAASGAARDGKQAEATEYADEAISTAIEARRTFPQDVRFLEKLVAASASASEAQQNRATEEVEAAVAGDGPLADSTEAAVTAADYFARTGRSARSETLLRRLLSKDDLTRQQRAGIMMGLSQLAAGAGRTDEALSLLDGYDDLPVVVEHKAELLGARFEAENGSEAAYQALRRATDEAINDGSLGANGLNTVAIVEMHRKDFDRARALLDASVQQNPELARTYALQAALLTQQPEPDLSAAAERLQQASSRAPQDAAILGELAQVQARLGRREETVATLRQLLALNPHDVNTRLSLIGLLLGETPPRYADAAGLFRAAEDAGVGDDPRLLSSRAQMEMRRGQRGAALDYARRSVEAAGSISEAPAVFNNYLQLLLEAEAYDEVVRQTQEQATQGEDRPWWLLRARGQALAALRRGREAEAAYAEAYEKAATAGTDGVVLRDMARRVGFEPAWALISEKIEAENGAEPTVNDLTTAAILLTGEGRRDEAIERLSQALAAVPEDDGRTRVALQLHLGQLHLQSLPRQLEAAEEAFREVLELDPENLGALNNLAYALTLRSNRARGDENRAALLDEAVKVSKAAYDLSVENDGHPNPSVTDTYAGAMAAQARQTKDVSRLREAERLLSGARQTAEANNSPFPEVYLHLAEVRRDLDDPTGAAEAAEAGIALVQSEQAAGNEPESSVGEDLEKLLREVRPERPDDASADVQAQEARN